METKRNLNGYKVYDPASIDNMQFNAPAGAQKQINVGCKLLPLKADATTYTTDATTARALPQIGRSIAVYNNSGTMAAVTFGMDATVTALAAGVTDANAHVGLPCVPNDWSYFSGADYQWLIASSANLLVFLIADDTFLTVEDPN